MVRDARRVVMGLVFVLLASTLGCSSTRLLADPQRGFEADGPRAMWLAFDRMTVDVRPAPEVPALTVGGEGERVPTVRLPLRASNATSEPWPVHIEDFDIARVDDRDAALPAPQAWSGDGTLLVVVPARGSARFTLPLRLPPDATERNGRYRLRYHLPTATGRTTILERDLVLDHFSPARQLVYATGFGLLLLTLSLAW